MKLQPRTPEVKKVIAVHPKSLSSFWEEVEQLAKKLEKRAYELFEGRGREDGRDLEDWARAESELFAPAPIEVEEKDGELEIRVEVPGFKPKELELNLEPGALILIGAHRKQSETKHKKLHVMESDIKEIFRKIMLPVNVDPNKATAVLKENGHLEIHAPKASQPTKVEVTAA